ncbi:mechanosensitive ion channel family protein [Sphingorhabdus arenilitoris]|uniref:Small-conductance mechanosensitive channel n=1 Tax=Sphingorhabdus arenilitoris TaxID=1490041 RepID=A0ABV8RFE1_9SPHN
MMSKTNAQAEVIELNPEVVKGTLDSWLDGFFALLPNIAVALVLIAVTFFLGKMIRKSAIGLAARRDRENLGEMLGSFAKWSVYVMGSLLAATIVVPSLRPGDLIAGLGIGTVAIGFAFKDILQNWLAGILILLKRPFTNGDQIEVDDYAGTIEHIDSRATIIKTFDGQRVIIPNSQLYTNSVLVKTAYRYRRSEYDVGIGYGDDMGRAKDAILKSLRELKEVTDEHDIEVLPWDLAASWVTLRVRWWTDTDQFSVVTARAAVIAAIKQTLDAEGVDMPYETVVNLFHDQTDELDGRRDQQREGWPVPANGAPKSRWQLRADLTKETKPA